MPVARPSCSTRIWSLVGIACLVASPVRYAFSSSTAALANAAALVAVGVWA